MLYYASTVDLSAKTDILALQFYERVQNDAKVPIRVDYVRKGYISEDKIQWRKIET